MTTPLIHFDLAAMGFVQLQQLRRVVSAEPGNALTLDSVGRLRVNTTAGGEPTDPPPDFAAAFEQQINT